MPLKYLGQRGATLPPSSQIVTDLCSFNLIVLIEVPIVGAELVVKSMDAGHTRFFNKSVLPEPVGPIQRQSQSIFLLTSVVPSCMF